MKKIRMFFLIVCLILAAGSVIAQHTAIVIDVNNAYIIGGIKDGMILSSDKAAAALQKDEKIMVYDMSGYLYNGIVTGAFDQEPPCHDVWYASLSPVNLGKSGRTIGISGGKYAFPTKLQITSVQQKVYIDAVQALFDEKSFKTSEIKIKQIIRTDLENDGVDEVIIEAERFTALSPMAVNIGDYSLIYMRKVINGKVENMVIESSLFDKTDEYFGYSQGDVVGILDVDGDGVCEVIVYSSYYEGESIIVYKYKNGKFVELMSAGCGV